MSSPDFDIDDLLKPPSHEANAETFISQVKAIPSTPQEIEIDAWNATDATLELEERLANSQISEARALQQYFTKQDQESAIQTVAGISILGNNADLIAQALRIIDKIADQFPHRKIRPDPNTPFEELPKSLSEKIGYKFTITGIYTFW